MRDSKITTTTPPSPRLLLLNLPPLNAISAAICDSNYDSKITTSTPPSSCL